MKELEFLTEQSHKVGIYGLVWFILASIATR